MITLKQLRYLSALAVHRHFGRAAEACSVTQPALSMQIRDLERQLGVQLVERRPGDVVLTDIGVEVADRGQQVLAEVRDLVDFARHRSSVLTGRLILGVIPTLGALRAAARAVDDPAQLSRPADRIARNPDPRAARRARARRARRRHARFAAGRSRHRDDGAVPGSVPAGGACHRHAFEHVAGLAPRHRARPADPAGGGALPARSGAGFLRQCPRRAGRWGSAPPASPP